MIPEAFCAWEGDYADLIGTHLPACPFHPMECPRGCGDVFRRSDLEEHLSICSANLERCRICGEKMRAGDLEEHM